MRYFYQNSAALKTLVSLFPILFFFSLNASAQKLQLKIEGNSKNENRILDSISYSTSHPDLKSINTEINNISEKLLRLGYIENTNDETKKINDTVFSIKFNLGKKTENLYIYIDEQAKKELNGIITFKSDTIKLPFTEAEIFLNKTVNELENKGFSLAKIKLINFRKINNSLSAQLKADIGIQRQVNDIVITGYDKFPEGHKSNIKRLYRNKTFNQQNLKKIYADFEKYRFVSQTKYPEILFTKDTTKVYVYLEKSKPNKFEGFVGFSNDDQKNVKLNGYLDLLLVNTLNSGEEFSLYWKSDGNDQKTFNIALELPYIFKTRFGLKGSLNIFKQDSTFQNTKTAIDLGYYFNYNSRLYLGYQSSESSDIQNQNNSSISDYTNSFITTNFEFTDFKTDDFLFPEKTKINLKAGYGSRISKLENDKQIFLSIDLKHNLYLNDKNSFNLKSQNYFLSSDQFIINELYRYGGINSIRGFSENSLQANILTSILTEYRYLIAPGIYAHTITDYAYFEDKTTRTKGNLLGIGFGFGILTKNGLLNLIYANGSTNDQAIKLSNSIIHISFKTTF